MKGKVLKVGTRKSALAIKQTDMVVSSICKSNPGYSVEVVEMHSTGDIRRDKLKLQVQDKKQWIIELENALLSGEIDLAVHSGKDVPLNLEEGTSIISVLKREDPRDVLVMSDTPEIKCSDLPFPFLRMGAKVGTSSKRRKAQLLRLRSDLEVLPCRGNVPTRIDKVVKQNKFDAIVLGKAGINRLSLNQGHIVDLDIDDVVPAVCQGTLVCQYRTSDNEMSSILKGISDPLTQLSLLGERAVIEGLDADCHSSLGVYCTESSERISIFCRVCSEDGLESLESRRSGLVKDLNSIADGVVSELVQGGARKYL